MGKAFGKPKAVTTTSVDEEAGLSTSSNSSQEHIVKPISTWKGYIWDTWELPKEERWLLFKVDAFVLTFASVRLLSSRQRLLCSALFGSHNVIDWLLPQESRPVQRQQCFPQRHARRSFHVWKSTCDKHIDLDGGICHWSNPIKSAIDQTLTAHCHSHCKSTRSTSVLNLKS